MLRVFYFSSIIYKQKRGAEPPAPRIKLAKTQTMFYYL